MKGHSFHTWLGVGEIRETAYLINPGNIFQEICKHFLRNTRIYIFIPMNVENMCANLEKDMQGQELVKGSSNEENFI